MLYNSKMISSHVLDKVLTVTSRERRFLGFSAWTVEIKVKFLNWMVVVVSLLYLFSSSRPHRASAAVPLLHQYVLPAAPHHLSDYRQQPPGRKHHLLWLQLWVHCSLYGQGCKGSEVCWVPYKSERLTGQESVKMVQIGLDWWRLFQYLLSANLLKDIYEK